ncbi:MAG: Gmad2 immunoglobulin-like domain-containing protein, partial [Actinomycetota bacterium]|nr:Gmad2 immunoglobulin-like domain-containing protein [Actinomycetota bacterium]
AAVLVAVLVSVAGCDAGGGNATKRAAGPAAADAPGNTATSEGGSGGGTPEPKDDGFVASAESSGGEAGAADRIEDVRFRILDDYERLLIDFGGRDGEAAGVPRWSVERPAQGGYVRVRLPGVTSTAVTGKDLIGSVLTDLYVVRDPDGGIFVDVFATQAFRYRATGLPGSGQLAIDLRGVREEVDFPPATGDRAVVLQPREAEEVVSPLDVRGYARSFEGRMTVSLLDRGRDVISSETVRADERAETWGVFETTLEFSGYEGLATLRVGGRSPQDGSSVGTETEVFLESSGPG